MQLPHGGADSPCLLNVALHGLEEAAGVRYRARGPRAGDTERGSPVAVTAACAAHPERFVRQPPRPPKLPAASWINRPGPQAASAQATSPQEPAPCPA